MQTVWRDRVRTVQWLLGRAAGPISVCSSPIGLLFAYPKLPRYHDLPSDVISISISVVIIVMVPQVPGNIRRAGRQEHFAEGAGLHAELSSLATWQVGDASCVP